MSHRDHFRIGPLTTVCHVYEGDGTRPILPGNLEVYYKPKKSLWLPEAVAVWRQEIEDEQRTRAVAGKDRRWNHPRFALDSIAVTRGEIHEDPIVELSFLPSDYFTFLAAQQLDRTMEEGEGQGSTLREYYLGTKDPVTVNGFLSSSFGANVAVVTQKDNKMLFSRRSATVGGNAGMWNSSANEGLSRQHDLVNGVPDLFTAARRALSEELAVSPSDSYDLELLSFAMDTERHQWAAFFLATLKDLTEHDLRDRWSRGIDDKWEHSEHAFTEVQPDSVLDFLLDRTRRDSFTACAPALFYHALVRTMVLRTGDPRQGRHLVESAVAPAIRRAEEPPESE